MPRYFFPMRDGQEFPDETGAELADLEAARAHAAGLLYELLTKNADLWDGESEWRMDIKTADEVTHATIIVVATREMG